MTIEEIPDANLILNRYWTQQLGFLDYSSK